MNIPAVVTRCLAVVFLLAANWILVNGLASAGFNNSKDVLTDGGSLTRLT